MGTNDEPDDWYEDDLDETPESEWEPIPPGWTGGWALAWLTDHPIQLKKGDVMETFIDENPRIIVRSPGGTTREYPLHLTTKP